VYSFFCRYKETDNNIEKFIGLQSTYVLLQNNYRKFIIQTSWDILDIINYFFGMNERYSFSKFFDKIMSIPLEKELLT